MKLKFAFMAFMSFLVLTVSAQSHSQSLYYENKGRIAISSDGNMHDNDDMQATMMTLMILAQANLQAQTTLYTYADHIWGSERNDLEIMRYAAEETGRRFGFKKTNFMAAVEDPEAAYNAMRDEILKSTPENPLFILAAGPMHVVGTAFERAAAIDSAALRSVTILSHSNWNDKHSDKPLMTKNHHSEPEPFHTGWTWAEMNEAFGDKVLFNRISDQNGTGANPYVTKNKFSASSWDSWAWMLEHPNKNVQWIFNQAKTHPCGPDFSDAGLAYYLCADLDNVRADQNGNPEKLRVWMGGEPKPVPAPNATSSITVLKNGKMTVADDFIAFAAEATDSPLGAWKLLTPMDVDYSDIKGKYSPTNDTYLEYTGGVISGANIKPGTDELVYKFTPKSSGVYSITGRMAQRLTVGNEVARTDLCNDVFVKMSGDFTSANATPVEYLKEWQKFYGNGVDAWGSFVQLDIKHKKYKALYNLEAGKEYTFHVSGRSKRCCIDYFILSKQPFAFKGREDVAAINSERYIPQFAATEEYGFTAVYNSVDFEKFTDMGDDFANATIDKRRGVLQMPARLKTAAAETVYQGYKTKVDVVLNTMVEHDGESTYVVYINGKKIGTQTNECIYGTDVKDYTVKSYKMNKKPITIKNGDVIRVEFNSATNGKVPEGDVTATSRGRWKSLELISIK